MWTEGHSLNYWHPLFYRIELGSSYQPKSKAKLLTLGRGEGEHSIYCGIQQEVGGSWCSKDLNSFMVSRGGFLKAMFGVKVTGFLTFFWLVSSEVTGLCFKNLNYQPSGSNRFIYYCGQESLRRNGLAIIVNKRVQNAVLGYNLKNDRMISVHFQGKIIQYHSNPNLCPDLKKLKLNGSMKMYKAF